MLIRCQECIEREEASTVEKEESPRELLPPLAGYSGDSTRACVALQVALVERLAEPGGETLCTLHWLTGPGSLVAAEF